MIEIRGLTKRYGRTCAVDDVTFSAVPGRVTGFLGLNGSGKTTTLRMLLGLSRPTRGEALFDGRRYRDLKHPLRQVGAVVEQGVSHPGQSGRAHLRTHAMLAGVPWSQVDTALERVGLGDAAVQRTGEYSLGMRQRLAVATALLANPSVLVLDEPANGLDPEGVAWLRELLRGHAKAGGTVLISSHLLAELAQLIDDVVVIAKGRIMSAGPLEGLSGGDRRVRVRGRDPERLAQALEAAGGQVWTADGLAFDDGGALEVGGLSGEEIGEIAFAAQVPLYELTTQALDLEQAFLRMVSAA